MFYKILVIYMITEVLECGVQRPLVRDWGKTSYSLTAQQQLLNRCFSAYGFNRTFQISTLLAKAQGNFLLSIDIA